MSHEAAVLTAKSLLEKPLSLLTEDDIAQITREECRRFLKERGMRRPSWNKSQAIQQVISLKALLEDRSDSDDPSAAVRLSQRPLDSSHGKEAPSVLSSAKDPSPYRRRDHPIPPFSTAGDDPVLLPEYFVINFLGVFFVAATINRSCSSVFCSVVDGPLGQLTIFYGGRVNVYDDVPSDRARDILQMAGSSDPCDAPVEAPAPSGRPLLNRFTPAYNGTNWAVPFCGIGHFASTPPGMMQRSVRERADDGRFSREQVPECPTSRKASLKRYLAKRKDRYKGRRIIEGMPSSSIELMCLSQNLSEQGQNELSSRSNSSSSLQPGLPRPPLSRCTSIETKKLGIYFDINDDGN